VSILDGWYPSHFLLVGAAITGMIIAIPTFIILFIAASKDEK